MNEAVVALVAALGAALLTAAGSLGVVAYQHKLRGKAADADAVGTTVTELLSRSFALSVRARTAGETARQRSGLGEAVDVATRQRKPVDLFQLHDWFEQDFAPLRAAWSELWSRGDQELVDVGNRLMSACAEVITAATDTMPAPAGLTNKVRRSFRGNDWSPEMVERLESSERALADARRELTLVARRKLARPAIDPYSRAEAPG